MATTSFTNSTGFSGLDLAVISQDILVSGVGSSIEDIAITLTGLSHGLPFDLDFMLVGPDGETGFVFWGNTGGVDFGISDITVTISDNALLYMPYTTQLQTG